MPVADLVRYDVSLSQRDDKSSDILHDKQRIVSGREMTKPDTQKLHRMVSKAVYRLAGDTGSKPRGQ